MPEFNERLDNLQKRLDDLLKWQNSAYREINQIKNDIDALRNAQQNRSSFPQTQSSSPPTENKSVYVPLNPNADNAERKRQRPQPPPISAENKTSGQTPPNFSNQNSAKQISKSNVERFIGVSLLSTVGILILIIGVAIIGKFAIDNNVITPLMRIVIGYIFGFGLLGFAFKLREKYLNFSAVLLSGAMAIMYFITFFAHSLYDIFTQTTAFVLMLIFTAFTVAAAINFNRQVIANIGLVGAYAIPFLLSNNSGNITFLLTYIAIINLGILAISIKKYWRSLFYLSFIFSWAIYAAWFFLRFRTADDFSLAFLFLSINFFTFYVTFLAYKLVSHEPVAAENVGLIFANSFIFYGIGYSIFSRYDTLENYLGLFTVGNAAIHFIFAFVVSRLKLVSGDLVYLLAALVLIFVTIAVPVQLDGQVVTLVWTAEAAILFWIGRVKKIQLFETYSLPLMFLAMLSLVADWTNYYRFDTAQEIAENIRPFFNGTFLTSVIFAVAYAFIFAVNRDKNYESALEKSLRDALGVFVVAVGLPVLYNGIRMEIGNYFHLQYLLSEKPTPPNDFSSYSVFNYDLKTFSFLWQLNFTMLFLTVLTLINERKFKDQFTALASIVLSVFALTIFLTVGLYFLGDLRTAFLQTENLDGFARGGYYIFIRYICYAFVAALLFAFYKTIKSDSLRETIPQRQFVFDFVLHSTLILVLTSELITWTEIFGYTNSYKLVTSIFWGIYAVALIILGIYQNKKYLRIGAISLFAVVIAKLFFYDIADLGTISKTVVFISLGILLLIASFLYNKYKSLIFDTN